MVEFKSEQIIGGNPNQERSKSDLYPTPAEVTISFVPNDIYLDMTNTKYLHRNTGSETLEKVNNYNYVSGFSFKMDASSSEKIMFYKHNPKKDYTYPIINETSIIQVDVNTAE